MTKLIFIYAVILIACNNSEGSKTGSDNSDRAFNWSKEDENEFLSGCIDETKGRYSEDTAYIYCNCVLGKVKQRFPSADSAASVLIDSSSAAEFTKDCD